MTPTEEELVSMVTGDAVGVGSTGGREDDIVELGTTVEEGRREEEGGTEDERGKEEREGVGERSKVMEIDSVTVNVSGNIPEPTVNDIVATNDSVGVATTVEVSSVLVMFSDWAWLRCIASNSVSRMFVSRWVCVLVVIVTLLV